MAYGGTGWCFVGVDLGQARDFTAVAVIERAELQGEWDAGVWAHRKHVILRLRYLERMPLGTPYPAVADRVVEITQSAKLAGRCTLVVDATGVGRPVVDLLRSAGPGCQMMPVTITGGDTETMEDGQYRVPKRDLVSGVQVLLQTGKLQIASRLPHGAGLAAEMLEMRVKVTASGNTIYGAWREGTHDDLVLAVSLACWGAKKASPKEASGTEGYWLPKGQREWETRFGAGRRGKF